MRGGGGGSYLLEGDSWEQTSTPGVIGDCATVIMKEGGGEGRKVVVEVVAVVVEVILH